MKALANRQTAQRTPALARCLHDSHRIHIRQEDAPFPTIIWQHGDWETSGLSILMPHIRCENAKALQNSSGLRIPRHQGGCPKLLVARFHPETYFSTTDLVVPVATRRPSPVLQFMDSSSSFVDLAGVETVGDLRHLLHEEKRAGRVEFWRLGGLSASDGHHSALLRYLLDLGLSSEPPKRQPHTVVLDWSTVDKCPADGLAFFSVIIRALREANIGVILCEPSDGDIARALERSGLRSEYDDVAWVPCESSRPGRMEVMAPAGIFGGSLGRGNLKIFFSGLDDALDRTGMGEDRASLIGAAAIDLVQNVLAHAGAAHAAVVAAIYPRRRPPMIEIGIADGGIGMATHLLSEERYDWLIPYTDATIIRAVFSRALSGRSEDAGGGGFSLLVNRLRDEGDAYIRVRSGAGMVTLTGPGSRMATANRLVGGWGTQTLITVRVKP